MYDPCGTQRLEGDDILKRLAEYLKVDREDLKVALLRLATSEAKIEDGGCGCGD